MERFRRYRGKCNGSAIAACRLYRRNAAYSEALYGILQHLEIFLRNGIHEEAKRFIGVDAWFDSPGLLLSKDYKSALKARGKLRSEGKPETAGRLVAVMTFGFWVNLLAPHYAHTLWVPALHKAFFARVSRKAAYQRLEAIRKLRNRVAHHEPVFTNNLLDDREMLLSTASWISPFARSWIEANENLSKALQIT